MPEPKPPLECPNCGGVHSGPCQPPQEEKKEVPVERVLGEEEKKEQMNMQTELESYLRKGWISNFAENVIDLAGKKNIPLDIISACQNGLEILLSKGWIDKVEEVISWAGKKSITLDFTKPEIASACQNGMKSQLNAGNINEVQSLINLAEDKKIPLDFTESSIASACQNGLEYELSKDNCNMVVHANGIINLAENKDITLDIASACQNGLESRLSEGSISDTEEIISFAEKKNIVLDFIDPEIVSACQKGLETIFSSGSFDYVEEFISWSEKKNIILDFTDPAITTACQKGLEVNLSNGWITDAKKFINLAEEKKIPLNFSKSEIASAVKNKGKTEENKFLEEFKEEEEQEKMITLREQIVKSLKRLYYHLAVQEKLPDVILFPEKSGRPLFYAIYPIIKKLAKDRKERLPGFQYVSKPDLELTKDQYLNLKKRFEEIKKLYKINENTYILMVDTLISSGRTYNFIREQFKQLGFLGPPLLKSEINKEANSGFKKIKLEAFSFVSVHTDKNKNIIDGEADHNNLDFLCSYMGSVHKASYKNSKYSLVKRKDSRNSRMLHGWRQKWLSEAGKEAVKGIEEETKIKNKE